MAVVAQCSIKSQHKPRKLFPEHIELNVGGKFYSTSVFTLTRDPDSLLGKAFTGRGDFDLGKDSSGKYFIDRDGVLFRYILDYLRSERLQLPDDFCEFERLKSEAEFFKMNHLKREIDCRSGRSVTRKLVGHTGVQPGYIALHVRGTFAFGRTGQSDINFRKLQRLVVCGRVCLCREVFKESLNESRDPNPVGSRYTNRFYLKHSQIEKAFSRFRECGFRLVSSCGGECGKHGGDRSDEAKWDHFNVYIFLRGI